MFHVDSVHNSHLIINIHFQNNAPAIGIEATNNEEGDGEVVFQPMPPMDTVREMQKEASVH